MSSNGLGSDKVQMQKIGNSKILVVKKKGGASSTVNSPPPMGAHQNIHNMQGQAINIGNAAAQSRN